MGQERRYRRTTPGALSLLMMLALWFGLVPGFDASPADAAAPISLPGTFEAENYTGYVDTTPGNIGRRYRSNDVDIESCTDPTSSGECYNVGWIEPGESLSYDVVITSSATYTVATRVATPHDGRTFHLEIDGLDVSGRISVPNTGGFQAWSTVTSPPTVISAGAHTLRIVSGSAGFNINNLMVTATEKETATVAPTHAPRPEIAGPVYHVATDGDDRADGSLANPWRSLSASMKKLRAGDTLLVRGGTYYERVEVRGESVPRGREDARITVMAYPGEEPLVVGIFWISNPDYWTFDNIDVTYDPTTNNVKEHMVRIYKGHDWVYQNSEIFNAHSYAGLLVSGHSTNWLITSNYIHDTAPSNDLSQDHLIYISDGSHGVVERNLLVGSPNGRGVKLGNPQPGEVLPTNVIVRYNTIVNSGSGNVGVSYDARDNEIYGNVLVNPGDIYYTVHAWYLTGPNNVVRDNLTFGSRKGVTKAGAGLVDGGNNIDIDPMLDATYTPTNPAAYSADGVLLYGHLAGIGR